MLMAKGLGVASANDDSGPRIHITMVTRKVSDASSGTMRTARYFTSFIRPDSLRGIQISANRIDVAIVSTAPTSRMSCVAGQTGLTFRKQTNSPHP